jgi:hypothetical protein
MRLARHEARREYTMPAQFWSEILKIRDHTGEVDIPGMIILKCIVKRNAVNV